MDYCSPGNVVEAIERILRQDQHVLRFMTVCWKQMPIHEALKAEMTKTEEEPAAPDQEETTDEQRPAEIETMPVKPKVKATASIRSSRQWQS
jgi:hypothetical protein